MAMIPYIIKTFRGGISDENDKGIAGSFKFGYGLDIHARNDVLTCKQAMLPVFGESIGVLGSNTGTTMTGGFNVLIPCSDGSLYGFTERGSIWAMNQDLQWTFVYNDENGNITGAAEWETEDGSNYLYWATASSYARKLIPGATTAPDTGSARWTDATQDYKVEFISSTAAWHTMKPAAGSLLIANNEGVSELTFDDVFAPYAMNVRPGNNVTSIEERNDYVILGSLTDSGEEEGHIWSWTPTVENYIEKKKIPIMGVNALITTEYALLQGGSDGELFFSDFNSTVPVNSIPGGGKVIPSGVAIENDLALFGFFGGTYPGIWGFGRRNKNRPSSLNFEYRLSPTVGGSTVSSIYAITNFRGSLIASWGVTEGSTTEYGVDIISSSTKATAIYEGLEFDAGAKYSKKLFDSVKITSKPLTSGTSYSVKFKLDNETDWRYAVLPTASTTYSEADSVESEWMIGKPGMTYEVGVELNPTGNTSPEILSINTYLDPSRYEH